MIFYDRGEYRQGSIGLAVDGPAFRFGFGLFETLFWDGGDVCRLDPHLARLTASLEAFGLAWEHRDLRPVIAEVARRNGLDGATARINVVAPVDGDGPLRPVVTARPYAPPPEDAALALALSPRPLHGWLGAHKTANHLHHHLEHKAALEAGLDGAALAAPGGWLLEAAHATLVLGRGGELVAPAPPPTGDGEARAEAQSGPLPGTALAAAREVLDIAARPVRLDELPGFDHAWALNSLMGMRCVRRIGEARFTPDPAPIALAEPRIRMR